jgi:hypothetical protein
MKEVTQMLILDDKQTYTLDAAPRQNQDGTTGYKIRVYPNGRAQTVSVKVEAAPLDIQAGTEVRFIGSLETVYGATIKQRDNDKTYEALALSFRAKSVSKAAG